MWGVLRNQRKRRRRHRASSSKWTRHTRRCSGTGSSAEVITTQAPRTYAATTTGSAPSHLGVLREGPLRPRAFLPPVGVMR